MLKLTKLNPDVEKRLPDTTRVLLDEGLWIHDAVEKVTVHGSRGPKGGATVDSDLDLCVVVSSQRLNAAPDRDALLREVLQTTLDGWKGKVALDLAAVFDTSGCGLRCLDRSELDVGLCPETVGCLNVFKNPGGFVSGPGVDCSLMYPLAVVWKWTSDGNCR